MKKFILCAILILLPSTLWAATPFELEIDLEETPVHIPLPVTAIQQIAMAPSPVQNLGDGDFFVIARTDDYDHFPNQSSCYDPLIDYSDCYSATGWVDRMVEELLLYTPFINWVQDTIDAAVTRPILDESLKIPLIGDFNVGLHIEDSWNDFGCFDPQSGPQTLANSAVRIGCKFKDDDDKAIDVREVLTFSRHDFWLVTRGATSFIPLPPTVTDDGSLELGFSLDSIDADIFMRQPEEPGHNKEGYYVHAAGKIRLTDLSLVVRVATYGGNLRAMVPIDPTRSAGNDIGLSLKYVYLKGTVVVDADAVACSPYCDASKLDPAHPDFGDQARYEINTDTISGLLGDAIRYLEMSFVYEAQRVVGAVRQHLTAMSILDTRELTHTPNNFGWAGYDPPTFEHPFGGHVTMDYGFWYRMDVDNAPLGNDNHILLFGGLGFELDYDKSGWCGNPYIPPAPRWNPLPYPDMTAFNVRDGRMGMFGAGIHVNVLNRALDTIVESGGLCFNMDKDAPVLQGVAEVLNTNAFSAFLPRLDEGFFNREMMLVVRPQYTSVTAPYDYNPAEDQPRVEFNPPYQSKYGPYDLSITIPHIIMEFYIDVNDDPVIIDWVRAFSTEVSAAVHLGLGWYIAQPGVADYPAELVGNCATPPYPCRVLRLSGKVESHLMAIEANNLNTFLDPDGVEAAIGNLLTIFMNGFVEGYVEVFSDLRAVFGMTFDPPRIFPEYDTTSTAYIGQTLIPNDLDDDGVYEYLSFFLSPGDTMFENGLADTLGPWTTFDWMQDALGLAPTMHEPTVDSRWDLEFYYGKEIYLDEREVRQLGLYDGATIFITSLGPTSLFQYQIDGGMFQNSYDGAIEIPKMFYGHHRVKVWAVDHAGMLEKDPAILEYDLIKPDPTTEPTEVINISCGVSRTGGSSLLPLLFALPFLLLFRRFNAQ